MESIASLRVALGSAYADELPGADDTPIEDLLALMQEGLFEEIGLIIPQVVPTTDPELGSNDFRLDLSGRRGESSKGLAADEYLVNETVDRLAFLNIQGRTAIHPANGAECAIVSVKVASPDICKQAGLVVWGPRGFVVLCLAAQLRRGAATLQTLAVTRHMLDRLADSFPALVRCALNRFTLQQMAAVLQLLLREGISVRDLHAILESLLSVRVTMNIDTQGMLVFIPPTDGVCLTTQVSDHVRIEQYVSICAALFEMLSRARPRERETCWLSTSSNKNSSVGSHEVSASL